MSGRAPDNRLVHFTAVETARPGDVVTVDVTYAAPHHLVADGPVRAIRHTAAGDAWERRMAEPKGVSLGMPGIGRPKAAPVAPSCS
jgi:tRNA-2-methylthio-N6-dimethylallyladenosine synthase